MGLYCELEWTAQKSNYKLWVELLFRSPILKIIQETSSKCIPWMALETLWTPALSRKGGSNHLPLAGTFLCLSEQQMLGCLQSTQSSCWALRAVGISLQHVERPGQTQHLTAVPLRREETPLEHAEGLFNAPPFCPPQQAECNEGNPHFCPEQQDCGPWERSTVVLITFSILGTMKDCKLWLNSQHSFKQLRFKTELLSFLQIKTFYYFKS